jgi:hypothetical protein
MDDFVSTFNICAVKFIKLFPYLLLRYMPGLWPSGQGCSCKLPSLIYIFVLGALANWRRVSFYLVGMIDSLCWLFMNMNEM